MSTKGDLWDGNPTTSRIYQETSEPKSVFGKFQGYNTYIEIEPKEIESFKMQGDHLYLEIKPHDDLPQSWKIFGGHIEYFDYDIDGIDLCISGDSILARMLNENRWDALAGINSDHYKSTQ